VCVVAWRAVGQGKQYPVGMCMGASCDASDAGRGENSWAFQ
jgi:hypothetical protein